jgi:hypothetical protein
VRDAVMETTKALTPAPIKKVAEVAKVQVEAEAGPVVPIEMKAVAPEDKADQQTSDTGMAAGQGMAKKAKSPAPKLQSKMLIIFSTCFGEKIIRRRNPRSQTLCPKTKIFERGLSV